jgi:hypothetical protein
MKGATSVRKTTLAAIAIAARRLRTGRRRTKMRNTDRDCLMCIMDASRLNLRDNSMRIPEAIEQWKQMNGITDEKAI